MLLLLSGLPGTGKSTFAEKMASERGHAHYDLERPAQWPRPSLHALWERDRAAFARAVADAHPVGVVLDWGFPPSCRSWVEELRTAGFTLVWFSAGEDDARRSFLGRSPSDLTFFEAQASQIRESGFPGRLNALEVDALGSTGHRSWTSILERIEENAQPRGHAKA